MAKKRKKTIGIDEHSSGLLRNRFTVNGKRYVVYGKTMDELREKEAQKRLEIKNDATGDAITFDQYYTVWIKDKTSTVRESSIRIYDQRHNAINRYTLSNGKTFGSTPLRDITPTLVRDLQGKMVADPKILVPGDYLAFVKFVLHSAVNDRILLYNPAQAVKPAKKTTTPATKTVHRALTKAEVDAFLDAAKSSWYYNLFVFLLHTGCRAGEAAALTPDMIDNNRIYIAKTVTSAIGGGISVGQTTKSSAGIRYIPLVDAAREAIDNQLQINQALFPENKYIFVDCRNHLINGSKINYDIARICKEANIERFSSHAFRDTFATRCVESGMQPKTLQEIMGHASINMTMDLYAHVLDEHKQAEMLRVRFR